MKINQMYRSIYQTWILWELRNNDMIDMIVKIGLLGGGWTNPSEKYARQLGSFPQVGMEIKNVWNHHLVKKKR